MVMRLTTVLCWIRSFKDRPWANRWNNGDVVHLIMCSRRTAVSSKKGDGGEICFKCDPRGTLMEGTMTDYALAFDLVNEQNSDGPRAAGEPARAPFLLPCGRCFLRHAPRRD